ncbi:MAG: AraC family transcriptional regulator [Anaerocolumna sp.]
MKAIEQGVLNHSYLYFHTASTQAQKAFFYPLCIGYFCCAPTYKVNRSNYDSFLIMYVKKGSGFITLESTTYKISENQIVIVDCYNPHYYYSKTGWEILWLHFDGVTAREYYNLIHENQGNVITLKDPYALEKSMLRIYYIFHNNQVMKEALVSKYITGILTDMIIASEDIDDKNHSAIIDEIVSYITEHLHEDLTLEQMANRVSLSPYYFLRVFQKETGFTPHKYLIQARIHYAKFLLKTTSISVKEIGFNCGFKTESSFCTTFRKWESMTPSEYRIGAEKKNGGKL